MNKTTQTILKKGLKYGKTALVISERILIELIELSNDMEYMRTHAYAVIGKDVREMRYENEKMQFFYERKLQRQAIKRLQQQKFIKLRKQGKKMIYSLTNDGKVHVLKILIEKSNNYFFDNRQCLVSFDFPEASNVARVTFCRFLKKVGFKFVQGSVWSIKKDISKEMIDLVERLHIANWVKVFVVV